jgi:uncharacterized membrane protein YjjP (DUF1212 family)
MRALLRTNPSERPGEPSGQTGEQPRIRLAGSLEQSGPAKGAAHPATEHAGTSHPGTQQYPPKVRSVLDLALRLGELLLATGEAAEDVEAGMLAVVYGYGLVRCDVNVTFTMLTIAYQATLAEPAWTASRGVRRRSSDYTRLAAVHDLVREISEGEVSVEEAYRRLLEIRRRRHPYPNWLIAAMTALLAGAASVLVGGSWLVFFSACAAALVGNLLASGLAERGLPEFYQYVVAAMPAATAGIALSLAHADVRSSAVITGGLFALLPGRALVAAVQDGLTAFYITSAARLIEVFYIIVGIVCGISVVLRAGIAFGVDLNPADNLVVPSRPWLQTLAAAGLGLSFAVIVQVRRRLLGYAVLSAALAWICDAGLLKGHVSPAIAVTVTSALLGLGGQLIARRQATSGLPFTIPGLVALLPGSQTYLGVLFIVRGQTGLGATHLFTAASTGLGLAVGVNLGGELARLLLPARPGQVHRIRPDFARRRPAGKVWFRR